MEGFGTAVRLERVIERSIGALRLISRGSRHQCVIKTAVEEEKKKLGIRGEKRMDMKDMGSSCFQKMHVVLLSTHNTQHTTERHKDCEEEARCERDFLLASRNQISCHLARIPVLNIPIFILLPFFFFASKSLRGSQMPQESKRAGDACISSEKKDES